MLENSVQPLKFKNKISYYYSYLPYLYIQKFGFIFSHLIIFAFLSKLDNPDCGLQSFIRLIEFLKSV